ncbi:hypothetical protein Q5P01_002852 [Channa striata]|uniref:Ig-like domain-containing protein n=1 Tax=Channa striata TaxID=64152 RepID=A0AA88NV14_CHASR|nr:hypothetical protein Q5P01_002852 [Channa striata]
MRSDLVTVTLLLVLKLCEGQVRVISSLQPIVASPGDDVILPCILEPPVNVYNMDLTVEWSKPDLKPDPSDPLSRVGYVHLHRNRREVMDMKIASYIGRTQLFTDDLKNGNISLRIFNVTLEDSGKYRCFIPKLRSNMKYSFVQLFIDPNFLKTTTTEMPLHPRNHNTTDSYDINNVKGQFNVSIWITVTVLSILMITMASGVTRYLYKRWKQKQEVPNYEAPPSEEINTSSPSETQRVSMSLKSSWWNQSNQSWSENDLT